jgi:arabinogalactan endo-1,4-beta-galactosidase
MNKFIVFGFIFLLFSSNVSINPSAKSEKDKESIFVKGADISWITEMEASGRKFYNAEGTEMDCFALMKSLGMNSIRLRVWVNPKSKYNNIDDVIRKAIRAKNIGMRIMIDFHYSDDWADPSKQTMPKAWENMDLSGLKTAIRKHTTQSLAALKKHGVTPEWVQIGNETNDGMLWPIGRASTNMKGFAEMINAGFESTKSVFPKARVIVHLANGFDNKLYRWMFDGLKANGAKYDIIGMSLYPTWAGTDWKTANSLCLANMNDMVARYNKEIMVVEIGMPWDKADDCKLFIRDLISKTKSVSNGKGLGVLYWEPQAYNWVDYNLGAFDISGKPTIAMTAFSEE